ncbi:VOC family protein [Sneathiella sp. HT1-7]|uniref:VOC family protein n=1 Tax=Sneathiella sp. HT1-7 TaxID=2887192 RepID=UPI001D1391A1|nr:VOC family protein [Sneathiella sp. HT1-7]MCC3305370.1 VOC family protein [Sneathiella sp. HT1-7]
MFKIKHIDHLVLRVKDIEKMMDFYIKALGCTMEKTQEAIGLYQLRAGSSLIDLVTVEGTLGQMGGAAPGKEARNLDHFCLSIENFDEEEIRAHLNAHGIDPGELKSRYGADGQGPSFYMSDPEGNVVELKGPPEAL